MRNIRPESHEFRSTLAEWMRRHRTALDISQAEAAFRAGMPPSNWSMLERGAAHWTPRRESLARMAEALDRPIDEALFAGGFDASEDGTGRGTPTVPSGSGVRRLTPRECERLQGFPDDWTLVPLGKRIAQVEQIPEAMVRANVALRDVATLEPLRPVSGQEVLFA